MSKPKWEGDLMLILCVINFSHFPSRWFRGATIDKMQVNNQGVEHDLRRIEQIYSRLYNNEDTLGETKLDIELKWRFRVTHQFNYSVVHNLICKVNKKLALRLRLDPMALRVLLSATVLEVSLRSFYLSNFANGSERKRLSAFTGR